MSRCVECLEEMPDYDAQMYMECEKCRKILGGGERVPNLYQRLKTEQKSQARELEQHRLGIRDRHRKRRKRR